MTPEALLTELEQRGVKVSLTGDKIRFEAPVGVLTPELKETVRRQKPALIALLEAQEAKRLLQERGWVAIHSKTLSEDILWCRDEKVIIPTRWKDAVRYTLAELQTLTGNPSLNAEGLKRIHKAKKEFEGKVIPVQDPSR